MPELGRHALDTALMAAGVVGPLVFAGDWAVLGAIAPHYSPVNEAISQLARQGASTRGAMTAGFVVYGGALVAYGAASCSGLPRVARALLAGTGLATLGVAVFSLDAAGRSNTHAAFAVVHYATLAAAPLVSARSWKAPGSWLAVSAASGLVCLGFLAASTFAPVHGLLQRIGLTLGDAWVLATAVRGLRSARRRPCR
jgi:hypothetical membrane protein